MKYFCPYCGSLLKKEKDIFYCKKCKNGFVITNDKLDDADLLEDDFDFIEEVLDEEDEDDLLDIF